MRRFPGVVGAVYGTLIQIKAPMQEPQAYVFLFVCSFLLALPL